MKPTPEEFAAAMRKIEGYAAKNMAPDKAAEFCNIVRKDPNVAVAMAEYFEAVAAGVRIFGPDVAAEALKQVWQKHQRTGGDQTSLAE